MSANLEIFNIEYYHSLSIKVSAVNICQEKVIVGDEKGNVYLFNMGKAGLKEEPINQKKSLNISGKKIEQISCLDLVNMGIGFFLSNSSLFVYSIPMFDLKQSKDIKESVYKLAFNKHKDNLNDLILVTKKKKIKFYTYNPEVAKLLGVTNNAQKEFSVQEYPEYLEFYGKWISYYSKEKHKLIFLDSNNGQEYMQDVEIQDLLYVKGSWLVFTNGVGLFMEHTGPKSMNPLMINQMDFVKLGIYNSYVFSLHEKSIKMFDINNSSQVQELPIGVTEGYAAKYLIINKETIFIIVKGADDVKFWKLVELPFESQINRMLKLNQFDEALTILNNNIPSTDENKPKIVEDFFVNCGWTYFKQFTEEGYKMAIEYFRISNVNIFELMYLFINTLKIKPIHESIIALSPEMLKVTQIENLVGNKDEKKIDQALKFLLDILTIKRDYYMKKYDTSSETNLQIQTLKFLKSSQSYFDLSENKQTVSLYQTLQLINSTLVKLLAKKHKIKKCAEIIDDDKCGTDYLSDGFISSLGDNSSKMVSALIYEKEGKYKEALEIWEPFGKNIGDVTVNRPAKDRAFRILNVIKTDQQYASLFEKNITWMTDMYYEQAFEIIVTNTILPLDYFISSIIPEVEKKKGTTKDKITLERFLNYLNKNKNLQNEKFQTKLVDLYIERIFEKCQKDNPTKPTDNDTKKDYEKLQDTLKTFKLYNKSHVLDYIKNSWMTEVEVFLYSELGKYNLALEKLIEIGKATSDFNEVFKFCRDNIETQKYLYNDLFKKLCDDYLTSINENKDKLTELLKKEILNVLNMFNNNEFVDKKAPHYKETLLHKFEFLDPFLVLEEIPQNWSVNDPIVFDYLNLSLIEYTHLNNSYQIMKNSCDMDLVYQSKTLGEMKNKNIVVDNDTICELCRKKIGTTIFVVYPNMKIYHSKCAPNQNVCPITKIDFSKNLL